MRKLIAILWLGMLTLPGRGQFDDYTPGLEVNQGFEGTGYDNSESWSTSGTDASNTIDPDYTGVVLAGSQSFRFTTSNAGGPYAKHTVSGAEEWYGKITFKAVTISANSSFTLVGLLDSGNTAQCRVRINGSAKTVNIVSGTSVTTVSAISTGTTYDLWLHYKRSTASNGTIEVSFATTGSARPTSGNGYASSAVATSTGYCSQVFVGIFSAGTTTVDLTGDGLKLTRRGSLVGF
jgi:hypothetical protein